MLKNVLASLGLGQRAPAPDGLSDGDCKALTTLLRECDDLEPGLGEAVSAYVLSGEGESLLLRLRVLPGRQYCLTGMLAVPVRTFQPPSTWEEDKAATARNVQRIQARRRALLGCEGWNPALFRRLGQVAAEINTRGGLNQHGGPGSAASPGWFRGVLDVVEWSWLQNKRDNGAGTDTGRIGVLSAARCLEMLAIDGLGTESLIDVCFGSTDYRSSILSPHLLQLADLPAVLAAGVGGVVTGLRRLGAAGQAEALDWLGQAVGLGDPALYDAVAALLVGGGKQVSLAALTALRRCDRARVRDTGAMLLTRRSTRERLAGVQILGRIVGPEAEPLLRAQAAVETVRAVDQALKEALLAIDANHAAAADERPDDETGYRSADGARIEVPPVTPLELSPFPPGADAILRPAAVEAERLARAQHAEWQEDYQRRSAAGEKNVRPPQPYEELFAVAAVDSVVAILEGRIAPGDPVPHAKAAGAMLGGVSYQSQAASKVFAAALDAVLARPGVTPAHLARVVSTVVANQQVQAAPAKDWTWLIVGMPGTASPASKRTRNLIEAGIDARALLAAGQPWTPPAAEVARGVAQMYLYYQTFNEHEPGLVAATWPLAAQHLGALDGSFGLQPYGGGRGGPPPHAVMRALDLLSLLPAMPQRFLPAVLDLAMGGHPALAPASRILLRPVKAATPMLVGMLTSSDAVRRQRAAALVARMGDGGNIPALRSALETEKSEAVRAALLRALVALGDDISDQFSEARLLAQATAGLKKTGGKLFEWFPLDALPAVAWADGRPVPPELVRWWLALADKVKLPGGDPLMRMTLDRLDRDAAAKLGTLVLSAFVAQDTRMATAAEAAAYAEAGADALVASYRRWNPDFTREQAFEQLRRQKLGEYLGSASDHRGILALARHVPGPDAVQMVRAFFRDHYRRTAQCKALLDCLAGNPHPAALQLLLATANRYRTASVQKHAGELVDQVADENGWSRDELADRTVPTGGLDADGVLELPVGDRVFRVLLDAAQGEFAVTLTSPAGKPIKAFPALPADATAEEKEELAAAKKAFAGLRKELKQTAELQQARLYEAMCAGRVWVPADFTAYLLRHPVMAPLCRRLVFAGLDAEGGVLGTFRPMDDGTLTGPADDAVVLDGFAGIRVAHRALVSPEVAAAWTTHLADYDVTPPFDQFKRLADLGALAPDATEIGDRRGWMVETFKLRTVAGKLGYQREQGQDGGFFHNYHKPFLSLGLAACIEFTGAVLPETNTPAALVSLRFLRAAGNGYGHKPVPLRDVPPVLLSEAWSDLHRMAEAGTGFDAEWEKKAHW